MKLKTVISAAAVLIFAAAVSAPVFSESYTLEDYITGVEKNSRQLKQAAKDVIIAETNEKAAKSQALPTIGAQAGWTRNLNDIETSYPVASVDGGGLLIWDDIDINSDNDFSFGLSLDQQVFNMKVFQAIRASKEYKLMTSSIYDVQHEEIITIAKKVYYQNYLMEKLYEVKKSTEENTFENYSIIKDKFENGIVSEVDLLRAEVDWKMTIPETTQAKKNLDLARINFKNLAGIPLDTEIILDCDISIYPEMPGLPPLNRILPERSDYKTLLREKNLRDLNIKASLADHYPTLAANFTYGVSSSSDDFVIEDETTVTTLGFTLTLPLYSGGALSSQDKKVRAEYEKTVLSIDQLEEDVMSEIKSIYLSLKEADERIQSALATMITAEKAYEITQASYNSGMGTLLGLKDARLSREKAEIAHISAVYEYLSAYFDWEKAVGTVNKKLPLE